MGENMAIPAESHILPTCMFAHATFFEGLHLHL
jgi:hypothetical protein